MKRVEKSYDVGVIIGRFQIHELHVAHKKVIEYVLENHDKVIMFLGVSPAINTRKNPLDFLSRKVMIEEFYGHRISAILPLHDKKSDRLWAKQVDSKVREIVPMGSVVLYGSRDSFIPYYEPYGSFDCVELESEEKVSATEIRDSVKNKVFRTDEFRAGMIYAANSTFPFNYCTIDVAILNEDETKVLLGRKPEETEFRFIGGFSDTTDDSLEQTVKREANEETGLEIDNIEYVCSKNVKDWRYSGESDRSIITVFYKAKKIFGMEKPNDDIVEVKWFDINTFNINNIVDSHKTLFESLKNNINQK
ncbi:MAG: NUDIX domain-containing protein [bacterium]